MTPIDGCMMTFAGLFFVTGLTFGGALVILDGVSRIRLELDI